MGTLNTKSIMKGRFNVERVKFNHYLIELFDVDTNFLKDKESLIEKNRKLIKDLNLRIVKSVNYEYKPQGLTIVFVLSSSHLIVHTWPEYGYLHIDLFSCSGAKYKKEVHLIVKKIFNPKEVIIRKIYYE
mgnify:CR=1 FL=1